MNVSIQLDTTNGSVPASELSDLAEYIEEECDLQVQKVQGEPQEGVKSEPTTLLLMLIGLGFTAINTLIAALNYWQSQRPKGTIRWKIKDKEIELQNLTLEQLEELIARNEQMDIVIAKR